MSSGPAGHNHMHGMAKQIWSITSGMYALSAHVQIANVPLSECAPILLQFQLEDMLRDKYRIGHSPFQFECDEHPGNCSAIDGLYCQIEEETHNHLNEG